MVACRLLSPGPGGSWLRLAPARTKRWHCWAGILHAMLLCVLSLCQGDSLPCKQAGDPSAKEIVPVLTRECLQSPGSSDWKAQSSSFEVCDSMKSRASLVFYPQVGPTK